MLFVMYFIVRRDRKFNILGVSDKGVGGQYWQTKEKKKRNAEMKK